MIKSKMLYSIMAFIFLVSLFTAAGVAETGKELKKNAVAEVLIGSSGLSWNPHVQYGKLVLTVSRPDNKVITRTFASGTIPGFDLSDMDGLPVYDGSYTYQLVVIPGLKANPSDREKRSLEIPDTPHLHQQVREGLTHQIVWLHPPVPVARQGVCQPFRDR